MTPRLGYQDAVFTLKLFLQERREKGINTCITFVDLIKACNSMQHLVIRKSLKILITPSKIIEWIIKLY